MSTAKKFFRYLALVLLIVILISLIRDIFFGQFSFQENEKLETLIEKKKMNWLRSRRKMRHSKMKLSY